MGLCDLYSSQWCYSNLDSAIIVMVIWHLEDMEVDGDLFRSKGQLYGQLDKRD